MLRKAGFRDAAIEADADLPDPVDLDTAAEWGLKRDITRTILISRMGGSLADHHRPTDESLRGCGHPLQATRRMHPSHVASAGLQQAKDYAELLDLKFAYSTNGPGMVEHDYTTRLDAELDGYQSPDEPGRR